jgi:hypothetical protein
MPPKKKNNGRDKIDRDEIEQEYGLAYALFKAFPELNRLLEKAVNQNWDPGKFQVELRQTDWFKNHSDVWRQNIALKFSDPSSYKERLANSMSTLDNLAGAFDADLSGKARKRLAERALLFGWDESQIRDVLANHVRPGKDGHYEGELSTIETQLRNTALRNGVKLNREQLRSWMRNIVRGNGSQEQFQRVIRTQAARQFDHFADQINSGVDLADIAQPYMQTMADVLELNPGDIDLYDSTIRRALHGNHRSGFDENGPVEKGKKAKKNTGPLTMSEFEDSLRADKRWQFTDQARDQATEYAIRLGESFGVL